MSEQSNADQPAKVMVVDDSECIRVTVRELFSHQGIKVATATGADECLSALREGFRGVILMDIMMPEKNGWDTIRQIKEEGLHKGNIFVMLTGIDVPDQQMDGLQEMVIDYITKPFAAQELFVRVRTYLGYLDQSNGSED